MQRRCWSSGTRSKAHTVGFRGSAEYQRWKALLHRFYDPFQTVKHCVRMV